MNPTIYIRTRFVKWNAKPFETVYFNRKRFISNGYFVSRRLQSTIQSTYQIDGNTTVAHRNSPISNDIGYCNNICNDINPDPVSQFPSISLMNIYELSFLLKEIHQHNGSRSRGISDLVRMQLLEILNTLQKLTLQSNITKWDSGTSAVNEHSAAYSIHQRRVTELIDGLLVGMNLMHKLDSSEACIDRSVPSCGPNVNNNEIRMLANGVSGAERSDTGVFTLYVECVSEILEELSRDVNATTGIDTSVLSHSHSHSVHDVSGWMRSLGNIIKFRVGEPSTNRLLCALSKYVQMSHITCGEFDPAVHPVRDVMWTLRVVNTKYMSASENKSIVNSNSNRKFLYSHPGTGTAAVHNDQNTSRDGLKQLVSMVSFIVQQISVGSIRHMNALEVSDALYSIQNMSSKHVEVSNLLTALYPVISTSMCAANPNPQSASAKESNSRSEHGEYWNAHYITRFNQGLYHMSSKTPIVRDYMQLVTHALSSLSKKVIGGDLNLKAEGYVVPSGEYSDENCGLRYMRNAVGSGPSFSVSQCCLLLKSLHEKSVSDKETRKWIKEFAPIASLSLRPPVSNVGSCLNFPSHVDNEIFNSNMEKKTKMKLDVKNILSITHLRHSLIGLSHLNNALFPDTVGCLYPLYSKLLKYPLSVTGSLSMATDSNKTNSINSVYIPTPTDVSYMLHALHNKHTGDTCGLSLFRLLEDMTNSINAIHPSIDATYDLEFETLYESMCYSYLGFRSMDIKKPAVRKLLSAVTNYFKKCLYVADRVLDMDLRSSDTTKERVCGLSDSHSNVIPSSSVLHPEKEFGNRNEGGHAKTVLNPCIYLALNGLKNFSVCRHRSTEGYRGCVVNGSTTHGMDRWGSHGTRGGHGMGNVGEDVTSEVRNAVSLLYQYLEHPLGGKRDGWRHSGDSRTDGREQHGHPLSKRLNSLFMRPGAVTATQARVSALLGLEGIAMLYVPLSQRPEGDVFPGRLTERMASALLPHIAYTLRVPRDRSHKYNSNQPTFVPNSPAENDSLLPKGKKLKVNTHKHFGDRLKLPDVLVGLNGVCQLLTPQSTLWSYSDASTEHTNPLAFCCLVVNLLRHYSQQALDQHSIVDMLKSLRGIHYDYLYQYEQTLADDLIVSQQEFENEKGGYVEWKWGFDTDVRDVGGVAGTNASPAIAKSLGIGQDAVDISMGGATIARILASICLNDILSSPINQRISFTPQCTSLLLCVLQNKSVGLHVPAKTYNAGSSVYNDTHHYRVVYLPPEIQKYLTYCGNVLESKNRMNFGHKKNKWEMHHAEQALFGVCSILQFPLYLEDFSSGTSQSICIGRRTFQESSTDHDQVDVDGVKAMVRVINGLTCMLSQTLPATTLAKTLYQVENMSTPLVTDAVKQAHTTTPVSVSDLETMIEQCIDKVKWCGGVLAGAAQYWPASDSIASSPSGHSDISLALSALMKEYLLPLNDMELRLLEAQDPMLLAHLAGGYMDVLTRLQDDHIALQHCIEAICMNDLGNEHAVQLKMRLNELSAVIRRLAILLQ